MAITYARVTEAENRHLAESPYDVEMNALIMNGLQAVARTRGVHKGQDAWPC